MDYVDGIYNCDPHAVEDANILTAISGDMAVAHEFFGMENINVVILYPKGKISPLQEKLFGGILRR